MGPNRSDWRAAMTANKELELKLEVSPARLPRLRRIPLIRKLKKRPRREAQVSVYFDTDTHKLRRNGVMLRVRRVGGRCVQTIKSAGNSGALERDEWEAEIAGREPDLSLARGTALEPLLKRKTRRKLKPVFETRVQRTVY